MFLEPTGDGGIRPTLRLHLAHFRAAGVRAARFRRALSTSVANQALSSATNFGLAFALLRLLPEADYGLYTLGLSGCYLFGGIGNAVLLTQFVVYTARKGSGERSLYAARILCWVCLMGLGLMCLALVVSSLASSAHPSLAQHCSLAPVVSLAAATFLTKDYFVRQAYAAHTELRALAINAAVALAAADPGADVHADLRGLLRHNF